MTMTLSILLGALLVMDLAIIVAIVLLNKRQTNTDHLLNELNEERRIISEIRTAVRDDLEIAHARIKESSDRVTLLASEAEMEIRSGKDAIAKEALVIIESLAPKIEEPLEMLTKKQHYIESLMKRLNNEKIIVQKLIQRGEKLCAFFDQRVPYEEVLEEITYKKFSDARSLLTRGYAPDKVAKELGLTDSEINLIASRP